MTFAQPLLLLTLLVVVAAAAVFLLLMRRPARYPVRYTNLGVLAQALDERGWRRYLPLALFLLALVSLGAAVARPHVNTVATDERATVVLVIDTSRSMQSQDVQPTRLAAARAAARAFLGEVPKRLRVGLIVFSGDAQVAAMPTADHELVRTSIDMVGPFSGYGGTAIGDAIVRAVELGKQAIGSGARTAPTVGAAPPLAVPATGLVSILFLSDGRQNRGVIPPLEGAARARAAGIPVHTVALGTAEAGASSGPGSMYRAPDPETLRAIARRTGGEFFAARSASSLEAAYSRLGSRLGRRPGKSEVTHAFVIWSAALLLGAGTISTRWWSRLP